MVFKINLYIWRFNDTSMTKPQQQFLELLRSGLWGKPADASIFQGEIDWNSILRIAREQTVQVLVANGIETLPKELWPPKLIIFKLMEVRTKTAKMHLLLNSVLAKITTALNAEGIPSVLLKGQGLAQNYLVPESRICGDIDLYVGEENIDKAYEVIAALTDEPQEPEEGLTRKEMHRHIQVSGVVVEVHRKTLSTYSARLARFLKKWTYLNLNSHFLDGKLPSIAFNQTNINIPPVNYNAVYILYHTAHHMMRGGVGLRQICDWAIFLKKHHTEINPKELKATLRRFHMASLWKEFCIYAVNILGLDPQYLPLAPNKLALTKGSKLILDDIFANGNFGHYRQPNNAPQETNIIKRKWRSSLILAKRTTNQLKSFRGFALPYVMKYYINAIKRLYEGK